MQESTILDQKLQPLLKQASRVFKENFSEEVFFERSVFTNWTCAIADCKYCYLSTKPKHNPAQQTAATRSHESILAEVILCKLMGWDIGYITGGLRVEKTEQLIQLLDKITTVYGKKIMMNYGPYSMQTIQELKPHLIGMGSAIESFDEELHDYICPSKPLKSLLTFLENLQQENLQKLITIILGLGEKKEDVDVVIENIKKYNIEKVQLCFLKPQENTPFSEVPSPNMQYMAYWAAKIRIACPNTILKVALVKDRVDDFSLLLKAGVNGFSRFMIFNDFATDFAKKLEEECMKANRNLRGNFTAMPSINIVEQANTCLKNLEVSKESKEKIMHKLQQYWNKLEKKVE